MAEQFETRELPDGSAEILEIRAGEKEPEEAINLVPSIEKDKREKYISYMDGSKKVDGKDILLEIGQVCVQEYRSDLASRAVWEENTAKSIKLFNAFMEKKNFPWENSSNVNLPFLSIAVLQFQARAYDALMPDKEVVKLLSTKPDDQEDVARGERVGRYMNYQLLYKMEDFESNMDKMLMQLPLEGSVYKKSYYDPVLKRNVSEYVSAFDFVYSYSAKNLESAKRASHVLYFTPDDIRRRVHLGVWREDAKTLGPGSETNTSTIKETADRVEGKDRPADVYNQERLFIEQHRDWDLDGDGLAEPYVITVDIETQLCVRITSRSAKDSLGKDITIEHFTEYIFFPNPEGSMGLGFGTLIGGLNQSANSILNEIIDAGSLANLQGGFYNENSGLKGKDFKFQRGVYKGVKTYGDDIRKSIYNFDFKGPSSALFSVLGLLFEYSKMVSSVSETMTGQMPASDTPATTVLALIEEGRKVFSSIHKRAHRSFKKELKKIYRLNSVYLDEREYFQVLGQSNVPQGPLVPIGKSDFIDTYDVIPVSDPNITSRAEKVGKAQAVVNDVRSNPRTAGNAKADYLATKRLYEALEVPNVDEILEDPQPQDVSPQEENAGFLLEKPATVVPEQDHNQHIQVHQEFISPDFSQYAQSLTPSGGQLAQQHIQEHLGQQYLKDEAGKAQQAEQDARINDFLASTGGIPGGGAPNGGFPGGF